MQKQRGFTLIELVVVIVILGILAATAMPRFVSMSSTARVNAITGLQGGINSAMAIAHSQSLVNAATTSATSTITMDGATVNMAYGYPDSSATGITVAMNGLSGWTVQGTQSATTVTWWPSGGSATCQLVYAAATASGSTPTITATTSGC